MKSDTHVAANTIVATVNVAEALVVDTRDMRVASSRVNRKHDPPPRQLVERNSAAAAEMRKHDETGKNRGWR
jgi:hypothetical protein